LFRKKIAVPDSHVVDLLYRTTDFLRQIISNIETTFSDDGFEGTTRIIVNDLEKSIENLKTRESGGDDAPVPEDPPENENAVKEEPENKGDEEDGEVKKIGEILVEMGEVDENALEGALAQQERSIGEILVESHTVSRETVDKAYEIQKEQEKLHSPSKEKRKDIRVDIKKLDELLDLVGELITAETIVYNDPEIRTMKDSGLETSINNLNKITRDLQEVTTSIRMIPLEGLFNKMKRLTRDLSHKFEKEIDLVVTGEETEMDRNVIELISDPLVHIIRNSIDHGIEYSEDRKNLDKPPRGNIKLFARNEGKEIWISVKDDGKGLDREAILRKAAKQGLLREAPETMSDEEVWNLIFEPGFSTAEKITDVSGRGVGMDVVRKNVERIGGKISLKSSKNEGTTTCIMIPLTLAIIEGITIRVADRFYSIPILDVREFFQPREGMITRPRKDEEVLRLRNELLPIIRMSECFGLTGGTRDVTKGLVVVVETDRKKACFLVDEVIGNQQIVIKSLSGYLGRVRGVSGCSVMGSGDVTLILDSRSLMEQVLN